MSCAELLAEWNQRHGEIKREAVVTKCAYRFVLRVLAGSADVFTRTAVTSRPRMANFLFTIPRKTLKRFVRSHMAVIVRAPVGSALGSQDADNGAPRTWRGCVA